MSRYIVKPNNAYGGGRVYDTYLSEYVGGLYPNSADALRQAAWLNQRDDELLVKHCGFNPNMEDER